jgi:hypothetical protein
MRRPPIALLIVGTTLIRLVFATTTGLGVDESYMVVAGRVLSLGYFDHPPASWWLSWSAAHLFGTEAPWAVRLPFILLFALSQFLIWRIGCLIADQRSGFWAAVALNLSPVLGVTTGTWVLPDGPLMAALLGAALCLIHALVGQDRRLGWWAGAGCCAGLALFSKYTAILPMSGALLYLGFSARDRWRLRRPGPYLAAAVALVVFAPVLLWNATHGWASFAFQGDRAAGLRFRPWMPLATLGGEALFLLPWIWLPLMVLFVVALRRGAPWTHRLLAWLAAPSIVSFALISAWSGQRILFHWAAPGYLMLFPLLGQAIAERLHLAWVRNLIAGTAVLTILAIGVVATQIQFDWLGEGLTALMRKDPTDEGLDWVSLRQDLLDRNLLPPDSAVAALNWRDAGKIGYALGPDVTMVCLNQDCRQFGVSRPMRAFAGQSMLVISPESLERAKTDAQRWFRAVDVLPPSSVRLNGRTLRPVVVLRGTDLERPP